MNLGLCKFLIKLIPSKKQREILRRRYYKIDRKITFTPETRALVVCPHADDELIGCGGVMVKYASQVDCVCIGSSGVAWQEITPEQRSKIRIKEFNQVMDELGIKNHWIFETYGEVPMVNQIIKHYEEYCQALDTQQYDYIFLPYPGDHHPEHRYITNELFKKILRRNGVKDDCRVVFYEVWSLLPEPNHFVDISAEMAEKQRLLRLYASQHVWIDYTTKVTGLNLYRGMQNMNCDYAEAYYIDRVSAYLKKGYHL